MAWAIDLTYAVLLTSLTASILFLGWLLFAFILERLGFINIIFHVMKGVVPFWFFPLSFLILAIDNVLYNEWGGFLFRYTPLIAKLSVAFISMWLVGVGYFHCRYISENIRLRRRYMKAPFVNNFCWQCFIAACASNELDAKEFRVVYSEWDNSPKIYGLNNPIVILPYGTYTEEELELIYTHELTHYLQNLMKLKQRTMMAYTYHFFNPFVRWFGVKVNRWGEYACDNSAQIYVGGAGYYFRTLLAMRPEYREATSMTQSNLVEKPSELEVRIIKIKRSDRDMSMKKKILAGLTMVTVFGISTITVSAATIGIANAYVRLYDSSVVETQDSMETQIAADGMTEYIVAGLEAGVIEEEGEVIECYGARLAQAFEWEIKKNRSKKTPDFSATAGQKITVTVVSSPSDAEYHMGIIRPDGSRLYVPGKGTTAHEFSVLSDGKYSVYVQNLSDGTITLSGSYLVTN